MFVSSYNTYIDTSTTKNTHNRRVTDAKNSSDSFSDKLQKLETSVLLSSKKLPVNYISNYKALYNAQQLQHQELTQNKAKTTFSKVSAMGNAKVAYEENAKTFSFLIKPKVTLSQTPKELPNTKISSLKQTIVNTYLANDNYYKITAA